jgi:PKD repeat protein
MPDTPLTAQFNPTAQPEGTTYEWDFGDGTTSDQINPIHTFGSPNQTYQVCLTITQPNGCTNTQCHNINFEGNPNGGECNANFNHTPVAMQPLARQFNNLSVGAAVVSWLWTFGDGGTANEPNPQHTFPANGMYQVCLTITNADASCTDTRCKEVYLGDMPPPPPTDGCHAFYHANHPEGNLLEWNFENASWGEDIVSWTWDFGDGTTAQGQNQTHTYEAIGNYQVCLTITNDSATCTNTYCHSIHIGDGEPPTELYNVGGKVTNADGSLAQYALVYLVRYNNIGGGMLLATDVQVIMPEDEGEYNFQHIPTGNYLVKAALMPLDANYANNLPTYYLSANLWNEAVNIALNEDLEQIDIQLIAGSNPGGPGFVSGLITEGAGRADAPIATEGLTVMLTTETGTPVAYTFTNADGTFSLANLPYGTYQVWVDVPGMYQQPYTITITPTQSQINNVSLIVSQTATATVEPELNYTLSVNPNPANDYATVDVSFETPTGFVAYMYDLSGKIVTQIVESQANTQHHLSINVANLPAGTYIFEMQVKGQSAIKQKMLKM